MTKEEAIKILEEGKQDEYTRYQFETALWTAVDMAIEALNAQKTGKWIHCKYPLGECSVCHKIINIQANEAIYCPCCGSRNTGYEEYE